VLLRELLIVSNADILQGASDAASGMSTTSFTIKMATVMLASLPILLFYPFIQKYFIKGAMVGAVKG
jgi:putative aldouronate transport system permease protein